MNKKSKDDVGKLISRILIWLAAMVVVTIVVMAGIINGIRSDEQSQMEKSQQQFCEQLADTLRIMEEDARTEAEIVAYISERVSASGSKWAFWCRGDEVLFAKNASTTAALEEQKHRDVFLQQLYEQDALITTVTYQTAQGESLVGMIADKPDFLTSPEGTSYEMYLLLFVALLVLLAVGSITYLTAAWGKSNAEVVRIRRELTERNEAFEEVQNKTLDDQEEEHLIDLRRRTGNRYKQYKFKFYLNARHAIYIQGNLGELHPHTWEMTIHVIKTRDDFVEFGAIEKEIEAFIMTYQDKILNEVEPFDTINPTLENCCDFFQEQICDILVKEGWRMLMMEMSETPSRSHVISLIDEKEATVAAGLDAEPKKSAMAEEVQESIPSLV